MAERDLLLTQQAVVQPAEEVLQIGLKFNTFQSGKFLNLLLRMVSVIYQKSQKHGEEKKKKTAFRKMDYNWSSDFS